ncbi:hypothetical protein FNJ84_03385 [Paracoccus sp. M683]|uniref:hypothetical protein n=1 Tax=Paracoccus sp. M683 TaxID=2594268 RepID=UPI0011808B41|nr:hypothetical protein [Paracoccus sp. M683]TRW98614.1 hypothetical protein FNJ84_03385 [Paracoccus sp. M683]
MPTFELNADCFGAFVLPVDCAGPDVMAKVTVTSGFSGTIMVDCLPGGRTEAVNLNLPAGWSVLQIRREQIQAERPGCMDFGYIIYDDEDMPVGTVSLRADHPGEDLLICSTPERLTAMADRNRPVAAARHVR